MQNEPDIKASILDRLIDHEPGTSSEPARCCFYTLDKARESVLRDVGNLLNTRRSIHPVPESDPLVSGSLFSYGVSDFISLSPRSTSVRRQIQLELERILMLFEPRLRNVAVRLDATAGNERNLRFRLSALLFIDPVTVPITFDTCFDINSGAYSILK